MRSLLVLSLCAACGNESPRGFTETLDGATVTDNPELEGGEVAPADSLSPGVDIAPVPLRDGENLDTTLVYAHSDSTLYAVDPRANTLRTVGVFAFPMDGHRHNMTDIAVNAEGEILGVTVDAIYRINGGSAGCSLVSALPGNHSFVGLTFLPAGVLDASREVLVGGATDGSYWRIDTADGNSIRIGQFQGGYGLSGDIVSVRDAATYATVRRSTGSGNDSLGVLDPRTGSLRILGDTGFERIYGLGYWRGSLFGFTRDGAFITLSASNGRGRRVSMPAMQFSGAGVTTLAPVAPL